MVSDRRRNAILKIMGCIKTTELRNLGIFLLFGPRRDEVTGEWRRLHKEELNRSVLLIQYCAGDKIEKNEMGWACGAYG